MKQQKCLTIALLLVQNWYDPFWIPYYMIGAKVYDFVAKLEGDSGVPNSHFIDKEEAKFQVRPMFTIHSSPVVPRLISVGLPSPRSF